MTDHHRPQIAGAAPGRPAGRHSHRADVRGLPGLLAKTFSNAELAGELNTVEAMLEREEIQRFVAWVRKQPLTKGVRVH